MQMTRKSLLWTIAGSIVTLLMFFPESYDVQEYRPVFIWDIVKENFAYAIAMAVLFCLSVAIIFIPYAIKKDKAFFATLLTIGILGLWYTHVTSWISSVPFGSGGIFITLTIIAILSGLSTRRFSDTALASRYLCGAGGVFLLLISIHKLFADIVPYVNEVSNDSIVYVVLNISSYALLLVISILAFILLIDIEKPKILIIASYILLLIIAFHRVVVLLVPMISEYQFSDGLQWWCIVWIRSMIAIYMYIYALSYGIAGLMVISTKHTSE